MFKLLQDLTHLSEAVEGTPGSTEQQAPAAQPQESPQQNPQEQQAQQTPAKQERRKVVIDPDVHLLVNAEDASKVPASFKNMPIRQKLHTLDRMYSAGQKLLLHIKDAKQQVSQTTNADGTTASQVHFDPKEKAQLTSRVLNGFKQLKTQMLMVVTQLDAEEQEYINSQSQVQ